MQALPEFCRREQVGKHPLIVVDAPFGKGRISLLGAQLLDWTPAGGAPVLWLSPGADFESGKPLRGGVPLCWPWFGPAQQAGLPQHGFARQMLWQLEVAETLETGLRLVLALEDDASSQALWPYSFRLELEILLGERIGLALSMRHGAQSALPIGFALHSYFAVPNALAAAVHGLDGATRHDKLAHETSLQQGALKPGANFDSVFTEASGVYRIERAPWPAVTLATSGAPSAIVWNPGIEKSPADMPGEAWQGMLCLEPGAAMHEQILLAPQQTHVCTMTIATESSNG